MSSSGWGGGLPEPCQAAPPQAPDLQAVVAVLDGVDPVSQ